MFLKRLIITTEKGTIIREVSFKKGLNIILGIPTKGNKGSTNNLGKTTLLRCIDFCLGARNLEEIYTDSENNKNPDNKVESFLRKVNPIFTLEISSSLDSSDVITIERRVNLNRRGKKYFNFIDGTELSKDEFENIELKKIFFASSEHYPTFRQLIGKFVRGNDKSLSNILKYGSHFNTDSDYEKIYFFLMLPKSSKVLDTKNATENEMSKFRKNFKKIDEKNKELQQSFYVIENELSELKNLRDEFKIDAKYDKEEESLKNVQLSIQQNEGEIASLKLKKEINLKRKSELEDKFISLKSQSLKYLYDEAKYFNKKLPRTFDELVQFHNQMINNEIDYLNKSFEKYDSLIIEKEQAKVSYVNQYNELLSFLGKSGSLAEYTKLNDKISQKSIIFGELKSEIDRLSSGIKTLEELKSTFDSMNETLHSLEPELDENLKIFNKYFSQYVNQIADYKAKPSVLSYGFKTKNEQYEFKISNIESNPGSGSKQALIMAFDLAYISFCNELKLTRPRFITQDKVEIIDEKILQSLFSIADQIDGQLIVPIIWDKVGNEHSAIGEDCILTLDSSNKFFCIEKFTDL